jgi:hypothetical protein
MLVGTYLLLKKKKKPKKKTKTLYMQKEQIASTIKDNGTRKFPAHFARIKALNIILL